MEITKKIFIVSSYGGQYEDRWEHQECAFSTKELAQKFIDEREVLVKDIDDKTFSDIRCMLYDKEEELYETFYDVKTAKLRPGKTEEEYDDAMQKFYESDQYELIQKMYNIDKETWDVISFQHDWDFDGYDINEIDFCDK